MERDKRKGRLCGFRHPWRWKDGGFTPLGGGELQYK